MVAKVMKQALRYPQKIASQCRFQQPFHRFYRHFIYLYRRNGLKLIIKGKFTLDKIIDIRSFPHSFSLA